MDHLHQIPFNCSQNIREYEINPYTKRTFGRPGSSNPLRPESLEDQQVKRNSHCLGASEELD